MNKALWKKGITFLLILSLIASMVGCKGCTSETAEETPDEVSAEEEKAEGIIVDYLEGTLEAEDASGKTRTLTQGDIVSPDETLITGKDSMAKVALDPDTTLYLDADSRTQLSSSDRHMDLTLTNGQLLLDVRKKLAKDETILLHASAVDVEIKGTVVFLQDKAVEGKGSNHRQTVVSVLEGEAEASYLDNVGARLSTIIQAGSELSVTAVNYQTTEALVQETGVAAANDFAQRMINANPELQDHMLLDLDPEKNGEENQGLFPANGNWVWTDEVTLVAQSASKVYDGSPLVRFGDVLVYGLPDGIRCNVHATGSQTKAGVSANPIGYYEFYNAVNENVTSHFSNVVTISGKLIVTPMPIVIWTGSSEKVYDGEPLTNPEAGVKTGYGEFHPDDPEWRNSAVSLDEGTGAYTLYGICGVVDLHSTNPLTGETEEISLIAGQKATVYLHDEGDQSIEFQVGKMQVEDLPESILWIYRLNPEMLAQACEDTGWDPEAMQKAIDGLSGEPGKETIFYDFVNAQIRVDSEITDYNNRALNSEEVRFIPVTVDPEIKVTATGSQTEVGSSENTYEIQWGNARKENYVVAESVGTLTVTEAQGSTNNNENQDIEITLTASSAEKVYDGQPLTSTDVTAEGLPEGYSFTAVTSGSQTDVGSSVNVVSSYKILDASGKDVTSNISKVKKISGKLTVTPLEIEVAYSGSFNYDSYKQDPLKGSAILTYLNGPHTGETLSSVRNTAGYSFTLFTGESGTITATADGKDAGTYKVTLAAQVSKEKAGNYSFSYGNSEMKILPLELTITTGSASRAYTGTALTCPKVTVDGLADADKGTVSVKTTGSVTEKGKVNNTYTISWGTVNPNNYTVKESLGTLEVFTYSDEVVFEVVSASKPYDGNPLKATEIKVTGLPAGYSYSATTTGSQTDAGTSIASISSLAIFDSESNDVTSAFLNITRKDAQLSVKKATVTITTGSASKVYDGTALTAPAVSVAGLVNNETVMTTVTGTITNVGTVENSYSIDWGTTKAENYDVTSNLGTLTVSKLQLRGTWTPRTDTSVYDGTTLFNAASGTLSLTYDNGPRRDEKIESIKVGSINGADVNYTFELFSGSKITMTVTGGGINAGTYSLTSTDSSNNYSVQLSAASITVQPLQLDISWSQQEDPCIYDGMIYSLENGELNVTCGDVTLVCEEVEPGSEEGVLIYTYLLKSDDKLTVTVNGPGDVTDAGTYPVTLTASVTGTASNYKINVSSESQLIVEPAPITIKTGKGEKEYDGEALTNPDVSVIIGEVEYWPDTDNKVTLLNGDKIEIWTTGTITDVGQAPNTYKIDWEEVNEENYQITEELGTLEITGIQIKAGSATLPANADGSAPVYDVYTVTNHVLEGYEIKDVILVSAWAYDVFWTNSIKDFKIFDGSGNDVTSSYKNLVQCKPGTLTVLDQEITYTVNTITICEANNRIYFGTVGEGYDIKNTNIEEVVNLCKVLVNQYGTAISDQTVIVALKAKGWI